MGAKTIEAFAPIQPPVQHPGLAARGLEAGRLPALARFARTLRATALPVAFLSALAGPASAAWEDNQCVRCHEAERLPISLGHSYEEWHASTHARVGVGCEKCHAGDPGATDPERAHEGVLPASAPASTVNATRLAATCGSCHPKELAAYSETVHAHQVRERKQGATCLTCHGSMATSLPSPSELRSRCAVCHEKPVQAQVALTMLAGAKIQLFRTARAVAGAKKTDPEWHADARERLHQMERQLADISLRWHTFAMKEVVDDSKSLYQLGKLLQEELEIRKKLRHQKPE